VSDGSPQGRVPDFFIVGHAKCGTTALYELLRAHPQVFMSPVKEPQFFARRVARPGERLADVPRFELTGLQEETLEQYLALYADARPDQLVGDASTFYLWSETAPARIAQARPDAKVIAILREPVSFLRSLHLQLVQNNTETEPSLRRAIALEAARREGRDIPPRANWPRALMYTDRVRYVEQLRRYEERFPPEQMLVLIYDDFRADNRGTLHTVQRFLGVEERDASAEVHANPTVGVRSVRLYSALRGMRAGGGPAARLVRTAGKLATTQKMRQRVLYPLQRRMLYRDPDPPDEELAGELRERFRGEVEALSEHLGRDLVREWGYERAAGEPSPVR
jgi:hypothetical protein